MHVAGAIDAARSDDLPPMNHATLAHGEPAVVTGAQGTHLAMNAHLLPFEPRSLTRSDRATPDTVPDASLLVELSLHDGVIWLRGRSLSEGKGGRCSECSHKHIFK